MRRRTSIEANIWRKFRHLEPAHYAFLQKGYDSGFAARRRDLVRALVIEDVPVEVDNDMGFVRAWGGIYPTPEALAERIGPRMLPYLREAFRQTACGWRLPFDAEHIVRSQACLNGRYWDEWLATDCPALLIRGRDSRVTTQDQIVEMARRRTNTIYRVLAGGHVVHQDSPETFADTLRVFLRTLTV